MQWKENLQTQPIPSQRRVKNCGRPFLTHLIRIGQTPSIKRRPISSSSILGCSQANWMNISSPLKDWQESLAGTKMPQEHRILQERTPPRLVSSLPNEGDNSPEHGGVAKDSQNRNPALQAHHYWTRGQKPWAHPEHGTQSPQSTRPQCHGCRCHHFLPFQEAF